MQDQRRLISIARDLCSAVDALSFSPPVAHVYNPLNYARASYEQYVGNYGAGRRECLMFGMNPGPWGMAQTGIPFGEVSIVRDWLGIEAAVVRPRREHPKRPVDGFACTRSEVSGRRLWGWVRDRFKTPERFFSRFFVANYCPLAFLEESGRNRTPDKLPSTERQPLFAACDDALRRTVEHFRARSIVAVGGFAETRASEALAGFDVQIVRILHPSPASPAANRDWAASVTRTLRKAGVSIGQTVNDKA